MFSNPLALIEGKRLTRRQIEATSAVEHDPMGLSCQRMNCSTVTIVMYQQAAFTGTIASAVRCDGVSCRDHW